MTSREYELFLTRSQKLAILAPVGMFLLGFAAVVTFMLVTPEGQQFRSNPPPYFPWFPLVPIAVFGLAMFAPLLALPYRITASSEGALVFQSRLRSVRVVASDVLSIEPSSFKWFQMPMTTYLLRHRNGKLRFPGQFTDQHQLFMELKKANPKVELTGC
jgi:hypothetical protein